ncbi:MAG TPA: carboxypeptidase-like regulatory domain-containing protein [Candidatus Thermoplasmatota archaeon]|nr:carboxypeptidase-like regulatory domain-containing protein [Candidatus Thermoplasmatota archaeon]
MVGTPRLLALAALLAATALAGCSGGSGGSESTTEANFEDLGLEATETTGIIRGIVVTPAIQPIAGATVTVTGGTTVVPPATTGADGAFGFDGLEPGTYFVEAVKVGFNRIQRDVEVVAGVAEPSAVRIVLEPDANYRPYVTPHVYEGFIECTSSILVLCGAPTLLGGFVCDGTQGAPTGPVCIGNVTNDRYTPTVYFDPNATMIQSEMVWETNQPLGEEMYFEMEALDEGCRPFEDPLESRVINSTRGPSPIVTQANATTLGYWGVGGDTCGIYYSTFSGYVGGGTDPPALPEPVGDFGPIGAGATVEQDFTWFIHEFHGYLPPEGWQFSIDGAPPEPPVPA